MSRSCLFSRWLQAYVEAGLFMLDQLVSCILRLDSLCDQLVSCILRLDSHSHIAPGFLYLEAGLFSLRMVRLVSCNDIGAV